MSDKTLLGLFVFLSISDESHLFWLTAMEVHIKERTGTNVSLFFFFTPNEQDVGFFR